jgi:hypothetical protein
MIDTRLEPPRDDSPTLGGGDDTDAPLDVDSSSCFCCWRRFAVDLRVVLAGGGVDCCCCCCWFRLLLRRDIVRVPSDVGVACSMPSPDWLSCIDVALV